MQRAQTGSGSSCWQRSPKHRHHREKTPKEGRVTLHFSKHPMSSDEVKINRFAPRLTCFETATT